MAWALIKKNGRVFRQHARKYDLLKWEVETKEIITKKTIGKYKSGDQITVIFRNSYMKWFSNNRRLSKEMVNEVNEVVYKLQEIEVIYK